MYQRRDMRRAGGRAAHHRAGRQVRQHRAHRQRGGQRRVRGPQVRHRHGLKGAGPTLGFDDVGRFGLEIEQGAKAFDAERVRHAADGLDDHLKRVQIVRV